MELTHSDDVMTGLGNEGDYEDVLSTCVTSRRTMAAGSRCGTGSTSKASLPPEYGAKQKLNEAQTMAKKRSAGGEQECITGGRQDCRARTPSSDSTYRAARAA